MTLTIERGALVAALQAVTKVVESRNTIPVMANVLLSHDGDTLTVTASDLDIVASVTLAATGALEATTAPAKQLVDVVKRMPEGSEVVLELDGPHLIVKSGRSRFKLATIPASDFPSFSEPPYTATFETDLAWLFGRVSFAVSHDTSRHQLNGVFLHNTEGETRAVATDGHRLAQQAIELVGDIPAVIIPTKMAGLVPPGNVKVSLSEARIRIEAGNTTIVSKLIEGNFPDYERVVPKSNDVIATFDRKALLSSVDRVAVFASERGGKAVKMALADGAVTLTTSGEGGEGKDELACSFDSEPYEVGFNAGYISELLRQVQGGTVKFAFGGQTGSTGPALLIGDGDWLGVCMPMRV